MLLALYLLKYRHGTARPPKQQVLNHVDLHHLIAVHEDDRKVVSTGEEAWANDLALRREDLKNEGCLTMPERGQWQITPLGEQKIIEWCAIMEHFAAINADWDNRLSAFQTIFEESVVITKDTVLAARRAYEIARTRAPDLPTVPPDVAAKIEL